MRETLLSGRPAVSENKYENNYVSKSSKKNLLTCCLCKMHSLPCANWTLQPDSCCILFICSPPRPMTSRRGREMRRSNVKHEVCVKRIVD